MEPLVRTVSVCVLSADPEPAVEQACGEQQGEEQRLRVPPVAVLPLQTRQPPTHLQHLQERPQSDRHADRHGGRGRGMERLIRQIDIH